MHLLAAPVAGAKRSNQSTLKNSGGCGSSRKSKTKAQPITSSQGSNGRVHLPVTPGEPEVLIEALFDFYVDAEGAVLVAQGDYGDVAIHVVFDLNDLLLG